MTWPDQAEGLEDPVERMRRSEFATVRARAERLAARMAAVALLLLLLPAVGAAPASAIVALPDGATLVDTSDPAATVGIVSHAGSDAVFVETDGSKAVAVRYDLAGVESVEWVVTAVRSNDPALAAAVAALSMEVGTLDGRLDAMDAQMAGMSLSVSNAVGAFQTTAETFDGAGADLQSVAGNLSMLPAILDAQIQGREDLKRYISSVIPPATDLSPVFERLDALEDKAHVKAETDRVQAATMQGEVESLYLLVGVAFAVLLVLHGVTLAMIRRKGVQGVHAVQDTNPEPPSKAEERPTLAALLEEQKAEYRRSLASMDREAQSPINGVVGAVPQVQQSPVLVRSPVSDAVPMQVPTVDLPPVPAVAPEVPVAPTPQAEAAPVPEAPVVPVPQVPAPSVPPVAVPEVEELPAHLVAQVSAEPAAEAVLVEPEVEAVAQEAGAEQSVPVAQPEPQNPPRGEVVAASVIVKVLDEVKDFVAADGLTYAFKEGDVAWLPAPTAQVLVARGKAVEVDVEGRIVGARPANGAKKSEKRGKKAKRELPPEGSRIVMGHSRSDDPRWLVAAPRPS